MSAPRKEDGVAPRQRQNLLRQRKRIPFELQHPVYKKLVEMAQRDNEAMVTVVERLIRAA